MIHPILSEKALAARALKNAKARARRKEAVKARRFEDTRNRVRIPFAGARLDEFAGGKNLRTPPLPCETCGGLPCLEGCPR